MIGRKLYYELNTGDIILITPEKHHQNANNSTKEQDFQTYDVLQARNPETIGVKQLEYGELRGDFEKANGVKIDINTGEILFDFPIFYPSHSELINQLQIENSQLNTQINEQKNLINELTLQLGDLILGGM